MWIKEQKLAFCEGEAQNRAVSTPCQKQQVKVVQACEWVQVGLGEVLHWEETTGQTQDTR